jgi:hypothetical protein
MVVGAGENIAEVDMANLSLLSNAKILVGLT